MIRLARLTDYSLIALHYFAGKPADHLSSARDVSEGTHVPLPTVSKILKLLTKKGFLASHRGVRGGYSLARSPDSISVSEVIKALEGPIALTDCHLTDGACQHQETCPVRGHWEVLNSTIEEALSKLSLAGMAHA
jgi:FeS assembly SUF system regulator